MIPIKGTRLTTDLAGAGQVVAEPMTAKAQPPIQIRRWARNGKHPNADLENTKNEHLNQIAMFRTKQVFAGMYNITRTGGTPTHANSWTRSRFAFHTGPMTHALFCRIVQNPRQADVNAYVQVDIYSDATESTLHSSETFYYGAAADDVLGWQKMHVIDKYLAVDPDTNYYAKITNFAYAQLMCAAVLELGSMIENYDGYLAQNITAQSPILDVFREKQAGLIKDLWKRGGSQVWNWTVEPGNLFASGGGVAPDYDWKFTSSTTATNILDLTSTTITAATPGPTFDMTGKARLAQTSGVPCIMKVFGYCNGGATGTVEMKDSGGAVIATATVSAATGQWVSSAAFNMPATSAKYDFHYKRASGAGGNGLFLWAVSIYEYEA